MKKITVNDIYFFAFGSWMTGFVLVGQRILAPYFGTFNFVWFSLVGSILCTISAGYIAAVFMQKQNPKPLRISLLLFFAGFYVMLLPFLKDLIISLSIKPGIKWGSALASLLLFAPPSLMFGWITPSFLQLRESSSEQFGNMAAKILASLLMGQFAGFLIVAYLLIPHLPNTTILFIWGILMMIASLTIFFDKIRAIAAFIFILPALLFRPQSPFLYETDSMYHHILITSGTDSESGASRLKLFLGNYMHACKIKKSNQPCSILDELYTLDFLFVPNIEKALVIGEGSFIVAQNLLNRNQHVKVKLVQMDRAVALSASRFFDLQRSPQLKIYFQDGRTFLNNKSGFAARQNILLYASKNPRQYTQYELVQIASSGQMKLLINHYYNAEIAIPPHIRLFTDNFSPCESCMNQLF